MAGRRKVLDGHRRLGKRFIPPLLSFGHFHEVPWTAHMLPEFVWLGLLNSRFGFATGAALARSVATAARDVHETKTRRWFAMLGDYACLAPREATKLGTQLEAAGVMAQVVEALAPLRQFYPDNPLNLLLAQGPDENEIGIMKQEVAGLFDRTGIPAMRVQVTALTLALGHFLFVHPDSGLADINAVQNYPETNESLRIAAVIRASLNSLFATEGRGPTPWSQYFWQRGLELGGCTGP